MIWRVFGSAKRKTQNPPRQSRLAKTPNQNPLDQATHCILLKRRFLPSGCSTCGCGPIGRKTGREKPVKKKEISVLFFSVASGGKGSKRARSARFVTLYSVARLLCLISQLLTAFRFALKQMHTHHMQTMVNIPAPPPPLPPGRASGDFTSNFTFSHIHFRYFDPANRTCLLHRSLIVTVV